MYFYCACTLFRWTKKKRGSAFSFQGAIKGVINQDRGRVAYGCFVEVFQDFLELFRFFCTHSVSRLKDLLWLFNEESNQVLQYGFKTTLLNVSGMKQDQENDNTHNNMGQNQKEDISYKTAHWGKFRCKHCHKNGEINDPGDRFKGPGVPFLLHVRKRQVGRLWVIAMLMI